MKTLNDSKHFITRLTSSSALLFTVFSAILTLLGMTMIYDTDPLWHIAAGDVIRTSGIPFSDPWSFTTQGYRWLNISWAWDSIFSWLREHFGWHGAASINAIIIATTVSIIFITCSIRSGNAYIGLLSCLSSVSMLILSLRPLQVTYLMTALWMLLLGNIFRKPETRLKWLALLPLLMIIWVNMHGGFIMGLMLIGAFTGQALFWKNKTLSIACISAAIGCSIAVFCNPYGIEIIEAVRRPLTTTANSFINEWQPFKFTAIDIALRIFLIFYMFLLPVMPKGMLPVERLLTFFWFCMSFTAARYMGLFTILAAPHVACSIAALLQARLATIPVNPASLYLAKKPTAATLIIVAIITAMWLPSPSARSIFGHEKAPIPSLKPEITYIKKHLPDARILTHFNIASIIAYETRGEIPIFVDPRTETAFPANVMQDYVNFHYGSKGWQQIFTRYGMTAAILPNLTGIEGDENDAIFERMRALKGWKVAFEGPQATLFVKSAP